MKTLEDQIRERCVHFTGLLDKKCMAGVIYDSVRDEKKRGLAAVPCFRDGEPVPCEKRHFPTEEEVAAATLRGARNVEYGCRG